MIPISRDVRLYKNFARFLLPLVNTLSILICLLGFSTAGLAEQVRLRCIADTNLSSYETERSFNYGQSSRLRLKGIQMLALFNFDTTPIAGWQIRKATLYMRYAGNDRRLRTLGISTISAPWKEGTGSAEQKPGEACFLWIALGQTRWAGENTDFTDVSFTAGHTIAAYSDITTLAGGWFSVPVEPRLVQAVLTGVSYGLAVSDEKGQTAANSDIYSREQNGSEPYLIVEGSPIAKTLPAAITDLQAMPDSRHSDFDSGAMQLSFTAPRDAFAYEVRYSFPGSDVQSSFARNEIPMARPGRKETITLAHLSPSVNMNLDVMPISVTGVRGAAARVNAKPSSPLLKPAAFSRPAKIAANPGAEPVPSGSVEIWAYPDTEKANPITGSLLEEVGAEKYSSSVNGSHGVLNAVWDGHAVRLFGARNEFVSFNLMVGIAKQPQKNITVSALAPFQSVDGKTTWKPLSSLFRDWYVNDGGWFPEDCVPLSSSFDIPNSDNNVPGQRYQTVTVDLLVPRDVAPGVYSSSITVSAEKSLPIKVPIVITVNRLTLPDNLAFDISLNTYGTLGGPFGLDDRTPAYRALEREYHRMAHLHRSTLAALGYSHTGSTSTNYAPPVEGAGANMHVRDWSSWDQQFGPYLDGSAFADLPRKGVPITHFYLPFHEAWPVDIRSHYKYTPTITDYPATISEHALKAPPIEQAFDRQFGEGFTSVARDFAEHFLAKGWTKTQFQLYQNDKYYYKDPKTGGKGTSWWLLDEPNHRDDWLALAYFDGFFYTGIKRTPGVSLIHREDISRPQWQRDYLDGHVELMVVSGEIYTKGPRLQEMREKLGVRYWNYGTANAVKRSNTEAEAWAVRAWLAGAEGIVPWQSVGSDENYARPEETALLLPGKRFGIIGPVASLRLKALRRAQQDVEYLVLLAAARKWDRAQVAAALRGMLALGGDFKQKNSDDAGSYQFGPLRAGDFSDVRRAIASELDK